MGSDIRTVGFLVTGEPTLEQRTAREWLDTREGFEATTVRLSDIGDGSVDPERFDVYWWHANKPIHETVWLRRSGVADRIRTHVTSGGGLLLSHLAVPTIVDFGFDTIAPDTVVPATGTVTSGFLVKAVHRDHPIFANVPGLRFITEHPGEGTALARYEQRLPKSGEVLAGNYVEGNDVPYEATVLEWRTGAGAVIGVGAHLGFGSLDRNPSRSTLSRFTCNLIEYLSNPDRRTQPMTAQLRHGDAFRRVRSIVDGDPNRPRYHFCPPANWQNDPSGIVQWNGVYHLFYNHNPAGPYHGTLYGVPNVKGHAVSPDLIHWEDRPIALWPTEGGPDEQGTWTGCIVDDDGIPTLIYTGASSGSRYSTGGRQRPCLAVAIDDDLTEWEKQPTPIIEEPPSGLDIVSHNWDEEFRDHCVWRESGSESKDKSEGDSAADDDEWLQLVGSGIDGEGGTALLYRSDDLREWEYCNPLLIGNAEETGTVWECPELFSVGDRHLLHVSCNSTVYYFLGEFDGRRFRTDRRGRLDYGDFYAPQTLQRQDGDADRQTMIGWIRSGRDTAAQWNTGWAGAMSLPRVLNIDVEGRLTIEPSSAIESLRTERLVRRRIELPGTKTGPETETGAGTDGEIFLQDVSGSTLEFDLEIDPNEASEVSVIIRRSGDAEEQTLIRYLPDEQRLVVDRSATSRNTGVDDRTQSMPVERSEDGRLHLRAFLDRSILELFAGKHQCLTSRIYPTRTDSTGVALFAKGGRATASLTAWQMASIW